MIIQQRLAEACRAHGDVDYRSYSGRFMYGKNCVGITGSFEQCMQVISIVIGEQAQEVFDTARDASDESMDQAYDDNDALQTNISELLTGMRMDNMGLDIVVYWPKIEYIKQKGFEEDYSEEDEA